MALDLAETPIPESISLGWSVEVKQGDTAVFRLDGENALLSGNRDRNIQIANELAKAQVYLQTGLEGRGRILNTSEETPRRSNLDPDNPDAITAFTPFCQAR